MEESAWERTASRENRKQALVREIRYRAPEVSGAHVLAVLDVLFVLGEINE